MQGSRRMSCEYCEGERMRSFPLDSLIIGLGDDGFPIYDSDYTESDIRDVCKFTGDHFACGSKLGDSDD